MSQWVSERGVSLLLSALVGLASTACGGKRAASDDEGHGVNVGARVSPGFDSGDRDGVTDGNSPQVDESSRCLDSPGLALPPCDELPPPPVIDASCTTPALEDVRIEPFSLDGFRMEVRVRCAPLPAQRYDGDGGIVGHVRFMAYIAAQDVWDELYATSNLDHVITGVDGDWKFAVPVTHIDETTLDDIQRCAGWFVGLTYSGPLPNGTNVALSFALTDRVTERASRGVGPVMTADEIPSAVRCTTMLFGE